MTTYQAIAAVGHLQQIKASELKRFNSTILYSNLVQLPFAELVEVLEAASDATMEDRINLLKKCEA